MAGVVSSQTPNRSFHSLVLLAFVLLPWSSSHSATQELVAFPGAEGFGRLATGGRGGDIYEVTNLDDSGAGSLRDGIKSAKGPRTIVFRTSGTISLKEKLVLDKSNLTIAGQTAPDDGVSLRAVS